MNEAIIDVEIGNQMEHGANWDNKKAEIICVGVLLMHDGKRDGIVHLIKLKEYTKEEYAQNIVRLFESLYKAEYKLWALNAIFEEEAIEANFGIRPQICEIRHGLHGNLSSKDNLYKYLQRTLGLKEIKDNLNGNTDLIPDFYKQYIQDDEYFYLQEILQHNTNCLLKEYHILKEIKTILKNAEVDKHGFIERFREDKREGDVPAAKKPENVADNQARRRGSIEKG